MNEPQNWWESFLKKLKHIGRVIYTFVRTKLSQFGSLIRTSLYDPEAPTDWPFKVNVGLQTIRKLLIYFVTALVVIFGLVLGLGLGYFSGLMSKESVPTYASMKRQIENVNQSSSLYFADDVKLADVTSDLIRTKTDYNKISPYLIKAVVATEDEDFYKHQGIVPKSIIRAMLADVTGMGTQTGGSTLTQQLVKMQLLSSETTWRRKAIEIVLALRVDNYFSKEQILESYLNVVTLGRNNAGQNIAGVETAAQGLFGVSAQKLSLAQAAFIAGLPQSPSIYTPYTQNGSLKKDYQYGLKRKDVVLYRMYRNGDITKAQYQEAKKVKLTFLAKTDVQSTSTKYGYMYNLLLSQARSLLIDQLIEQNGRQPSVVKKDTELYTQYWTKADTLLKTKGYKIQSTVKKDLYDQLQTITETASATFGRSYTETAYDENLGKEVTVSDKVQTGSIVLDNETGAVLAFVGGRDFNENQTNHAFNTQRSPGSSIKPLISYGPAIENNIISSKSLIADFSQDFNGYKPTDYNSTIQNRFIPADEALASSYNLPAVNLYNHLMNNTSVKISSYMTKMGIDLSKSEYSQLGLALGGTDTGITVEQNASAFATYANNGNHVTPYVVSKITAPNGATVYKHKTKKTKVFSKATSYIMQQMMKKTITSGTASQLNWRLNFNTTNFYGKTGTSNDYRDIWFVGSTPGITMASWMGYDNFYGNSHNLTSNSSSINLRYWANMANAIYQRQPNLLKLSDGMKKPDTVKSHTVLAATGTTAGSITFNNKTIDVSGAQTTALFNNSEPSKISTKFAIGGTDDNYQLFWEHYQGSNNGYGTILYIDSAGNVINKLPTNPSNSTTTTANSQATTNKDTNNSSGENTDAANNSSGNATTSGGTGGSNNGSSSSSQSQSSSNTTSNSSSTSIAP